MSIQMQSSFCNKELRGWNYSLNFLSVLGLFLLMMLLVYFPHDALSSSEEKCSSPGCQLGKDLTILTRGSPGNTLNNSANKEKDNKES